jgi:DNA-binding MarR family transcriptional regulator
MSRTPRLPGARRDPTSGTADICVCAAFRLLTRFACRELSRALLEHGISVGEFHLLLALEAAPAPQMALARSLHLDPAAVSRIVRRLAEREEIAPFSPSPRAFWRLTARGQSTLEFLCMGWESVDSRLREYFGDELLRPLLERADRMPGRRREPSGSWRD